jgi:predicted RNA-binding protein with PUA-like domain
LEDERVSNAIARDNLGAWLLKCNPSLWDFAAYIASGEGRIQSWAVQRNYRAELMAPGDRVLFWISGDGRSGLPRGVWGDGHVVAPVENWVDAEHGYWHDDGARRVVRARVRVDIELRDEPVTAADLRAFGVLDLEVQRMPQGANPSWVSVSQLARVDGLLRADR